MPRPPRWPNWSETIAVFGGRFDPPHLGHAEAVRGLFTAPGVKQVWVLPSPTPPHKAPVASFEHRLAMAKLAFRDAHPDGDSRSIRLDLREAERAHRNPGMPTYSFDTLQDMRREVASLAFVIGTDQLEQLPSWHRFPDLLRLCHWIVLARKPDGLDRAQRVLNEWEANGLVEKAAQQESFELAAYCVRGSESSLTLVPTEAPELSSTRIREQIARAGEPPQGSLSPEILAYLKQNGLYGIRSDLRL